MNIAIINLSTYRGDLSAVTRADRRTCFGNPFIMKNKDDDTERDKVILAYREYLWANHNLNNDQVVTGKIPSKVLISELTKLLAIAKEKPLILGCWCAPKKCHCDVIKSYLEWRLIDLIEYNCGWAATW